MSYLLTNQTNCEYLSKESGKEDAPSGNWSVRQKLKALVN